MDDAKRARLRALYEGIAMPWEAADHVEDGECFGRVSILCDGGDFPPDEVALIDMGHDTECDEAHAALIVGAVNALPALLDALDAAECERDALRAEIARLRAPRPSAIVLRPVDPMPLRGLSCACDEWGPGHLDGCPNGDAEPVDAPVPWDDEDMALADGDRRALDVVTRERDEARAEVERLREDRDALKGALDRANELRIGDRAEARLDEREACAKICDEIETQCRAMQRGHVVARNFSAASEAWEMAGVAEDCAEAIRARGAGGGA